MNSALGFVGSLKWALLIAWKRGRQNFNCCLKSF
jgi:hypothetical protein